MIIIIIFVLIFWVVGIIINFIAARYFRFFDEKSREFLLETSFFPLLNIIALFLTFLYYVGKLLENGIFNDGFTDWWLKRNK